jgi:hypothetical protein
MTESFAEQTGLSIAVYEPSIDPSIPSYTPQGNMIEDDIASYAQAYSHTIKAIGGFWDATINLVGSQLHVESWIERLGYHIDATTPALDLAWAGFIDKVSINIGPLSVTIGPFGGIANYVWLVYSTVDVTGSETAVGHRASTSIYQDTTSQNRYGFKYKVLSSGGVTPDAAADMVQTFLEENRNPKTSQAFSGGAAGGASVTLDCLGYVHFLKHFIYNSVTTGTWTDVKDQIEDVLGADPNGLFSTNYDNIDSNTVTGIKRYDNDDRTAWDVIKGAVAIGDGTDHKRWLFGIYDDYIAHYSKIPSTLEYQQALSDPSQQVYGMHAEHIKPWNVRPGKLLQYTDFLVGESDASTLEDDLRIEFIEEVTYTAPWQISHRGGNMETLSQKMAALGLAGIGA